MLIFRFFFDIIFQYFGCFFAKKHLISIFVFSLHSGRSKVTRVTLSFRVCKENLATPKGRKNSPSCGVSRGRHTRRHKHRHTHTKTAVGKSSDPALRRQPRHRGTRPATSVLVSRQDVCGGTQTSTFSPPALLPSLRSRFWKCSKPLHSLGSVSASKIIPQPLGSVYVTEINSQNPGSCVWNENTFPNLFLSVMTSVSMELPQKAVHAGT